MVGKSYPYLFRHDIALTFGRSTPPGTLGEELVAVLRGSPYYFKGQPQYPTVHPPVYREEYH